MHRTLSTRQYKFTSFITLKRYKHYIIILGNFIHLNIDTKYMIKWDHTCPTKIENPEPESRKQFLAEQERRLAIFSNSFFHFSPYYTFSVVLENPPKTGKLFRELRRGKENSVILYKLKSEIRQEVCRHHCLSLVKIYIDDA